MESGFDFVWLIQPYLQTRFRGMSYSDQIRTRHPTVLTLEYCIRVKSEQYDKVDHPAATYGPGDTGDLPDSVMCGP